MLDVKPTEGWSGAKASGSGPSRSAHEGDAGLLVERVGFLPDGRAIEFCQSYYRGDTYDFVAELSSSHE